MTVNLVTRKSFKIRPSGRSTDFISPSFGYGCLYNCTYCYMKRHLANGLNVATNIEGILTEINSHSYFADVIKPNQTDPQFITYDIGCNEDFALHLKYYNWMKIFDFFKEHDIAKASFATKYVNRKLLEYNPERKVRIRFSLIPEQIQFIEPNTSPIIDRIKAINEFIEAGYDVHVNFSPIIVYDNWLENYRLLFELLNEHVNHKNVVQCECIFLTHNKEKHNYNLEHNLPGEELLWTPSNQEDKVSQYGGMNIRYQFAKKEEYIEEFINLHNEIIPWNTIRYIF